MVKDEGKKKRKAFTKVRPSLKFLDLVDHKKKVKKEKKNLNSDGY